MLRKNILHLRVGIFIVVALALGMLVIFMIGSEKRIFESHYTIKSTFSDISGLRVGAPVQLAGVGVGVVDAIKFPKDLLNREIIVTLRISQKYKERIREDSVATINTQGLLGDKFIYISIGSLDKEQIPNGGFIQSKEVVGLFELAEKGGEIISDLQTAAKAASDFFGGLHDGKQNVQDILTSIKNIVRQAEKGKSLVHALIYDPKGQELLEDVADTMHSIKSLVGGLEPSEDSKKQARSIAKSVNKVAFNLSEITEKINDGQGTIGGLINDPSIYNDIRSIFGKANRNALFKTVVRATLRENDKEVLK